MFKRLRLTSLWFCNFFETLNRIEERTNIGTGPLPAGGASPKSGILPISRISHSTHHHLLLFKNRPFGGVALRRGAVGWQFGSLLVNSNREQLGAGAGDGARGLHFLGSWRGSDLSWLVTIAALTPLLPTHPSTSNNPRRTSGWPWEWGRRPHLAAKDGCTPHSVHSVRG